MEFVFLPLTRLFLMAEINDYFDTILILDFGGRPIVPQFSILCSQYSHLITRRCCEQNVYVELIPCTRQLKDVKFKPKVGAPVLVFGADFTWIRSKDNLVIPVYDKDSPHADPGICYFRVPILGYA